MIKPAPIAAHRSEVVKDLITGRTLANPPIVIPANAGIHRSVNCKLLMR
jgi:hypothetical protein